MEGDTWYHEWQDISDVYNNEARCSLCTCKKDSYDNLYADCGYETSYTIGSESCPLTASETHQCHRETSITSDPSTLELKTCSAGDDEYALGDKYCSWGYNDYGV